MTSKNPVPYDPWDGPSNLAHRAPPGVPAAGMGDGMPGMGHQPPGGPSTGVVQRTLSALMRFKWMILAILLLGAGAAYVATRFQRLQYRAQAQVWFNSAGLVGGAQTGPIRQGTLLDNAGWQSLLRSSAVLDSVIVQRRLFIESADPADSLAFTGFKVSKTRPVPGSYRLEFDENQRGFVLLDGQGNRIQSGAWGDSIGTAVGFEWVPQRAQIPEDGLEFEVMAPADVRMQLAQDLNLRNPTSQGRPDETFLILSLEGPDRQKITATLQAIIRRFEQVALELKTERLAAQTEILKEQLDTAQAELARHETAFETFQVNTATLPNESRGAGVPVAAGLQMTTPSVFANYFNLSTEKDQLARDREALGRALQTHQGEFGLITALEVNQTVKSNSALTRALQEVADAEAQRRALEVTLTPAHPQVQQKIQYRDSLLQKVIPQLAGTLAGEMQQRERDLDGQISNLSRELREIPGREIRSGQLQRQVAIADALYRQLEEKYQASRLAEVTQVPDMQIITEPEVPFRPISDTRRNLFLMILAGSLGLGLALAVLRDRIDPRVQYPDQVTAGMGLNILGAVPALRGGRLGAGDMALAVEAFRSIQLSLTHAAADGGPITVTFSSPGASDGKSFVTSNLAIAFADMGHRTLVIDGDVRRGRMHKLLGATHKPGLTDYLSGRTDRESIIQETRYPLLHFIGCGSRQDGGPKLLGSPVMRNLMRDLRADYDVILVDSPPLGACVDPMILATMTRNMVLVVRSGSTDRALAESKLDALDRLPVRVLGAVLNDVSQGGPYRYYSYMTGYELIEDDESRVLPSHDTKDPARNADDGDDDPDRSDDGRPAAAVGDPDDRAPV